MLTVSEALESILAKITPLESVTLPLLELHGLILTEEISADIDLPPFDNSAVDGYAVIAADTSGAKAKNPIVLKEVGTVTAGADSDIHIESGSCARVMTGAMIPSGANAM